MENNFINYTETQYLTKEELKNKLNLYNVDSIWDKLVAYRSNFASLLDICKDNKQKFSICYYRSLLLKECNLERKMLSLSLRLNRIPEEMKNAFKLETYNELFHSFSINAGIEINPSYLNDILTSNVSLIPNNYLIIKNYFDCYKKVVDEQNELNISTLNTFNSILNYSDGEINSEKRSIENEDNSSLNSLEELEGRYFNYINDKNEFPFIKISVSLFYLNYLNIYSYFSKETSVVFSKLILAKEGFLDDSLLLNLEGLMFFNKEKLSELVRLSLNTYDLTYYVNFCLDYISKDLDSLLIKLEKYETNSKTSLLFKDEKKIIDKINDNEELDNKQLIGKIDVALPKFNTGLKLKDIDKITKDLLETYPQMKYSQAHFYASHCTVGRFYTIQQFKQYESTSYETARTSMDFLVELGFYNKMQIKNKFVYRPIVHSELYEDE